MTRRGFHSSKKLWEGEKEEEAALNDSYRGVISTCLRDEAGDRALHKELKGTSV